MYFKSEDYAVGWLAGIIDGEGCVSKPDKRQKGVQISNTDTEIIRAVGEVLSMLGISYGISETKNHEYNHKHKKAYCVRITNRDGLERLFRAINLASEKKQGRLAEMMVYYSHVPKPAIIDWKDVVDLYLSGLSMAEVARRYGVSPTRIATSLRRCGITKRSMSEALHISASKRRKYSEKQADLVRLYQSGVALEDCAKQLGIPKSTASEMLKRSDARISRSESNRRSWAKRDMEKWKVGIRAGNQNYWRKRRDELATN